MFPSLPLSLSASSTKVEKMSVSRTGLENVTSSKLLVFFRCQKVPLPGLQPVIPSLTTSPTHP